MSSSPICYQELHLQATCMCWQESHGEPLRSSSVLDSVESYSACRLRWISCLDTEKARFFNTADLRKTGRSSWKPYRFSIQPLTILGVTGPFSVLAENIYSLCVGSFNVRLADTQSLEQPHWYRGSFRYHSFHLWHGHSSTPDGCITF